MDIIESNITNKDQVVKRKTTKKQIMIYDTKRKVTNFINRIKYRKLTNYNDVPHFIITKDGQIIQLVNTEYYTKMFDTELDKKQIKIALENLGGLHKNAINNLYYNWVGDKTFKEPLIKRWRNFLFWDRYSAIQIEKLKELCSFLSEKHGIINKTLPTNSVHHKTDKFEGIVYKSNFSDIYTDINPSFKFNFNE